MKDFPPLIQISLLMSDQHQLSHHKCSSFISHCDIYMTFCIIVCDLSSPRSCHIVMGVHLHWLFTNCTYSSFKLRDSDSCNLMQRTEIISFNEQCEQWWQAVFMLPLMNICRLLFLTLAPHSCFSLRNIMAVSEVIHYSPLTMWGVLYWGLYGELIGQIKN